MLEDPSAAACLPRGSPDHRMGAHEGGCHPGLPTVCDEWSIRDLLGHVVESNLWVGQLLDTRDYERVVIPGDALAPDPVSSWRASAALVGFQDATKRVRHPVR